MMSKELFLKAINEVQKAWDYQEGLNDYFRNSGVDGYVFQPDCGDVTVELLEAAMGLDVDETTGYTVVSLFCYEYEFGRKFKMGDFVDGGVEVDLSTAENLWEYLTKEKDNE